MLKNICSKTDVFLHIYAFLLLPNLTSRRAKAFALVSEAVLSVNFWNTTSLKYSLMHKALAAFLPCIVPKILHQNWGNQSQCKIISFSRRKGAVIRGIASPTTKKKFNFAWLWRLKTPRQMLHLRVTTQSKSKPCFEFDLTILNRFFLFPKGV